MRIQIFEDNLMWAPRLAKSVAALGHEPVQFSAIPDRLDRADLAIVNLGSRAIPPEDLIPKLKAVGTRILAHAGHKEKELLDLAKQLGVDECATNSQLTFKIESILRDLA